MLNCDVFMFKLQKLYIAVEYLNKNVKKKEVLYEFYLHVYIYKNMTYIKYTTP